MQARRPAPPFDACPWRSAASGFSRGRNSAKLRSAGAGPFDFAQGSLRPAPTWLVPISSYFH
jgi:hypothetical protein